MAFLPDPASAGLYGVSIFLVTLGVLVIFVETVTLLRLVAVVIGCVVLTLALIVFGEWGLSLLPLAFAGAFVANHLFEWLTTR